MSEQREGSQFSLRIVKGCLRISTQWVMLSNKCQQLTHAQQEGASCTILLKGKNSAPETHEILEKALLIYADLCPGPEVGLFREAREE